MGEPAPKLHDLRHAYATAPLAAGLTVHALAELLGHSPPIRLRRSGTAPASVRRRSAPTTSTSIR